MAEPAPHGQLARALRRSWRTVLVCALAGLVVAGVLHVVRQAQYQATSEVYIAEGELNQFVLGVAVSTDPSRDIANDLQLAASINYQQQVASDYGHGLGYKGVQSNLAVTNDGSDDILKFTATAGSRQDAVLLANTSVAAYNAYRAAVLSRPILSALDSGGHTVTEASRLQLLRKLNQNAVIISQARTATAQEGLVRDLAIGLVAGLVVGLLLMALREAVPLLSPDGEDRRAPSRPVPPAADPPAADPPAERLAVGETPPRTGQDIGDMTRPVSTRPSTRRGKGRPPKSNGQAESSEGTAPRSDRPGRRS